MMNIKQLLIISFVSLCTITNAAEQAIITPEYLLQNTTLCAQNSRAMSRAFLNQYRELEKEKPTPLVIVKKATDIAKDMIKQNPLCFIGECMADGCYLTRSNYPQPRTLFENRVSSLLKKQVEEASPNTAVKYASFGSGSALPELIVATKVLLEKADAHLTLCLIDLHYESLVALKKKSDEPSKIKPQSIDSLYAQDEESLKSITNFSDGLYPLLFGLLLKKIQHQQFINWLTEQFPQAHLALHIYQSVDQYLEHNASSAAHVVAAVDCPPHDLYPDPLPYYQQLCLKTLQLNPTSNNVSLQSIRCSKDSNATLYYYYLNNESNPEAKLISFQCKEQEEEQIYETKEQLTMHHASSL